MRLPIVSIGFERSSKGYIAFGTRTKYATEEKYFQFIVWLGIVEFVVEIS